MENTKKLNVLQLIAAICCAVLAAWEFIDFAVYFVRSVQWSYTFWSFLRSFFGYNMWTLVSAAAWGALAYSLFANQKNIVFAGGFALLAVKTFLNFFFSLVLFGSFSFVGFVRVLLCTSAFLVAAAVAAAWHTALIPAALSEKLRSLAKTLWFIPAAVVGTVMLLLMCFSFSVQTFLNYSLQIGVLVLCMLQMVKSEPGAQRANSEPCTEEQIAHAPKTEKTAAPEADGFCAMAKHVLLLIFTCGVWLYIWVYRTTAFLNRANPEKQRNPVKDLLLSMFVPVYFIIWTYRNAQRIDALAKRKGMESDISTLCLVMAILVGIVPPIVMQSKINEIVSAGATPAAPVSAPASAAAPAAPVAAPAAPVAAPVAPVQSAVPFDATQQLRNYKQLLDDGIITQEEFDAKKKQLLGL